MRAFFSLAVAIFFAGALTVDADQTISSLQQKLKEQGFYYGEITGTKDGDTTAAIRRYQIRNGLKITGELSAETQKSLGLHGGGSGPAPTPTPAPRNQPPREQAPPAPKAQDDTSDLRANGYPPTTPSPLQAPAPTGPAPGAYTSAGVFAGTPYETAPPDVQWQIVAGAQAKLTQQGYYRGIVDGSYGPGTANALIGFQTRARLAATGRLDAPTLAALGLLRARGQPAIVAPRPRVILRPRAMPVLPDERLYIPR